MKFPNFWLEPYSRHFGLGVMRQNSPYGNGQMIVSITLPEKDAAILGAQIIEWLNQYFPKEEK